MAGKFPSIPASKSRDPSVEKLREAMELGTGQRKNQLDRWITLRDLQQSGIGRLSKGGFLVPGDAEFTPRPKYKGPLFDLEANAGFQNIVLSWDGINQSGYSYTEIWRYDADNLANAALVGTAQGRVYADPVPDDREYWYWVRAVSETGHPGAFNQSAGTPAQTSPDYETVRDVLTATEWAASTAYSVYNSVVPTTNVELEGTAIRLIATNAGTSGSTEPDWSTLTALGQTIADGGVTWQAVEAGKIPFYVDPVSGLVVIDGAAMREASIDSASIGSLAADKIFVASGTIAQALIGDAEIQNAMIYRVEANKLYADTGTIATAIIGTGHIGNAMIANAAITTAKIGSAAITNAKIGDAAVNTLQLAGQAVTFPNAVYTAGSISVSLSGYSSVASFTVATTGAPVMIQGSFQYTLSATESGTASLRVRVLRGGTVIYGPTDVDQSDATTSARGLTGFSFLDGSPGASSGRTYALQLEADISCTASARSLLTLETKR